MFSKYRLTKRYRRSAKAKLIAIGVPPSRRAAPRYRITCKSKPAALEMKSIDLVKAFRTNQHIEADEYTSLRHLDTLLL